MGIKTDAESLRTTHEQPDVAVAMFYRPTAFLDFSQPLYPAGNVPGRISKHSKALKQVKDGE